MSNAAVSKPKWCQWCGSAQSGTDGDDILFECGSWHSGSTPEFQWSQCKLNVAEQRIQRALHVLQKLDRYNVEPCSRMEWSKQGDWVDFCSVSKAIDILQEGQQ